jgi:hypothetical protein
MPDLSYFKLRQLEAGDSNVVRLQICFAGLIEIWYMYTFVRILQQWAQQNHGPLCYSTPQVKLLFTHGPIQNHGPLRVFLPTARFLPLASGNGSNRSYRGIPLNTVRIQISNQNC